MAKDNESWILDAGDAVIERRADPGAAAPTRLDRLIYCLWVADYGMRNAGDLAAAADVHPDFQDEAARLSRELGLPLTESAFAQSPADLERRYFELFDGICDEIRAAQATTDPGA